MVAAIVLGLCAAAAWGTSDCVTAVIGRRAGSFVILVTAHATATMSMTVLALTVLDVPRPTGGQVALLLALGALSVLTYLSLFRALELGPLPIVSPVISSWVVVTVLLALVLLDEPLGAPQVAACALIIGGVLLGSARPAPPVDGAPSSRRGLLFALGAMTGLGLYNFSTGHLSQDLGWFLPLYASRGAGAVILLGLAKARDQLPWRRLDRRTLLTAMAFPGTVAILGGMLFNAGARTGHISVTAAAVSVYPLIPVAGGVFLLRERIVRRQVVGLGAIIAGLMVLGLTA